MTTIVQDIIKKTKSLNQKHQEPPLQEQEKICSWNTKTGFSINFPIYKTCQPTKACMKLCYGAIKGKPITWDKALLKYLRVLKYFKNEKAEVIADKIAKEYYSRKMSFLRWNGVGDLFQESVDVINCLTTKYPDIVLWVVTRIPPMAAQLSRTAPNLYIMFSLDNDPESAHRKKLMDSHDHPRVYYSFLRENKNDDTLSSRIVFNAQQLKKELVYDDPRTTCPVDAGMIPVKDACVGCRKCFSKAVFQ